MFGSTRLLCSVEEEFINFTAVNIIALQKLLLRLVRETHNNNFAENKPTKSKFRFAGEILTL
jgi:hypothetical protein